MIIDASEWAIIYLAITSFNSILALNPIPTNRSPLYSSLPFQRPSQSFFCFTTCLATTLVFPSKSSSEIDKVPANVSVSQFKPRHWVCWRRMTSFENICVEEAPGFKISAPVGLGIDNFMGRCMSGWPDLPVLKPEDINLWELPSTI